MSYQVTVVQSVSQVINVSDDDAENYEQAIDYALDAADVPNISNKFEPDNDPRAITVTDGNGTILWEDKAQ